MMKHHAHDPAVLADLQAQAMALEAALAESVDEALRMHKRIGNPVATWQDGRVVLIPADQIPVDEAKPH